MTKSSASCKQRSTCFQILCYALERWARIHNQMLSGKTSWRGSEVHHNTDYWTQLMEYFFKMHHIAVLQQTRRIHRTDYLHVDVQRHLTGMKRNCARMRTKRSIRFLREEIFSKTIVILRTWIRKEMVFYSWKSSKPQGEWDRVAELIMIKFTRNVYPVFCATSSLSRGALKSNKSGGRLSIHFCVDEGTIETFSQNYFC